MDACFRCLADQLGPQTIDGLTLGAIYALIALGYTLVYGVLRLINFAHSEIFMVGVFASLFAMHGMGIDPATPAKSGMALVFVLVVVMLAGMAASGGAAVIMERVAYRPLRRRNAPRLAALITAVGISLFLQELYALRYGRNPLGFPRV
ncbi:MAG: branched-chain amino acid ABC transporter permease, partial [Actinomycetota bacterium]|nr:branched-chain amino acid ABC transporter permease [Actinomycetota bacterium]